MTNNNGTASVAMDNNEVVMDEFGRDAAERTVELSPRDAEAIDHEVTTGKHQTFDDALAFVLAHGFKELARIRKAAEGLKQARIVKTQIKVHEAILASHPELIADPNFVSKMMAALGVKTPAAR